MSTQSHNRLKIHWALTDQKLNRHQKQKERHLHENIHANKSIPQKGSVRPAPTDKAKLQNKQQNCNKKENKHKKRELI